MSAPVETDVAGFLNVEPAIYYDAGQRIATAATEWLSALLAHVTALDACGEMCGTYEEAVTWAKSYDDRAAAILDMGTDLAEATSAYGCLLSEMGYNHELAEHDATLGTTAPPPDKPPSPPVIAPACYRPIPSAGGDGKGLIDAGLEIVQKVGVPIPDGDTGRLGQAADAWRALIEAPAMVALPAELERAAQDFLEVTSPEAVHIDEDLRALKHSAEAMLNACVELANSTREHRDGLDQLRADMRDQLEEMGWDLLKELAITLAIGVATSVITLGIGTAVASARAVQLAAKVVTPLKRLIDGFKLRRLGKGVKTEQDLAKHVTEVKRIKELKAEPKKPVELQPVRHPPGTARIDLTPDEQGALNRYVSDGSILNQKIRAGEQLTPDEQAWLNQVNQALDKFPPYEGTVTRRVEMTPEEIARYREGAEITEQPFTSSSAVPGAAKDRNVEFQIFSKDGKYIGQNSHVPEEMEVLFKSPSAFQVVSNTVDPATGRTIIVMGQK